MPYETCWVLSDGRRGMENQCLGLAEAVGLPIEIKHIAPRAPWAWLPESVFGRPWPLPFMALGRDSDSLEAPWPRLLIACGRKTVAYSAAIKKLSGAKTFVVQAQDPRIDAKYFDLVVPPTHDELAGDNVVPILGSPHRINETTLAQGRAQFTGEFANLPRPLVAVLIGGTSKHYTLTKDAIDTLILHLRELANEGFGLAITTSRRTDPQHAERLKAGLEETKAYFWDGAEPNPYFGLLGLADHVLVTEESTNLVTEAAATGKPVHVIRLEGGSPKIEDFHRQMIAREITRPFQGHLETWTYEPLNETARVAEVIKKRLEL